MGNDTYCSGCKHPCGLCYLTRVCQTVGCAQCNHGPKFMQKGSDFINTLESVPVVGYGVSGHYARFDQNDDAIRVAAKCTKSTLTTIGGIAGGFVGQPHIGAMIGNGIGIGAQHGIKQHIKDNPTFGSVVMDMGISGATSFVGGQGSNLAKECGMNGAKQFVSNQVFSSFAKQQLNGVKNGVLSENQKTSSNKSQNYTNNTNYQSQNSITYSNTQNSNPQYYYALFSFKNRKYLSAGNTGLLFNKDQITHTTELFYQVQDGQDLYFYTHQKQLINKIPWEMIQFEGYVCFIDPYKPHLFCCCTNTGALGWTQQEGDQSTMFAVQQMAKI